MSNFEILLKNSRLAQIARPLAKDIGLNHKKYPTHQVIETNSPNLQFREYGLKSKLPNKTASRYISINDLDNKKRMPDYEINSNDYFRLVRFNEIGLPLKTEHVKNPLFHGTTQTAAQKTTSGSSSLSGASPNVILSRFFNLSPSDSLNTYKKVLAENPNLRKEFYSYVMKTEPSLLIKDLSDESASMNLKLKLKEFLQEQIEANKLNQKKFKLDNLIEKNATGIVTSVAGTAGLSYKLKGRLTNTPNGSLRSVVAPGRILSPNVVGIAGFGSAVQPSSISLQSKQASSVPGKHQREIRIPFRVVRAELLRNGSVQFDTEGVKLNSNIVSNAFNFDNRRSNRNSSASEESIAQILNLLKN